MTTPRRRVTAADVARSLGLSRATVGFVLNNTPGQTIPESTRRRVLAEAERLGYRPNPAARALASGRSRVVLLVLPDWPIDYSLRVHLEEASLALDEAGYSLVTTTPHPGGRAQPLWRTLSPDVVIGLTPFPAAAIADMRATGVRRIVPDATDAVAPFGSNLWERGPRLQIEHLVAQGRRRLAFAGSSDPRIADLVADRRRLAAETAAEAGLELVATPDVGVDDAGEAVGRLLDLGVDGIAAYNDEVAAIAIGAAIRAGADVPGHVSVVGHDDSPLAAYFMPSITTVRVDTAHLGRHFADLVLRAAEGAPLPPPPPASAAQLVRREST